MSYLLDTDTCIYWLKGRQTVREQLLLHWAELAICSITVAELYYGAYNSSRVSENIRRAEQFTQQLLMIGLSTEALRKFGELKSNLRRAGQPIADFDLMIASVALTEERILVTNNLRHYRRVQSLQIENWA